MASSRLDGRLLWGGLMIVLGFFFLLQNLGIFDFFGWLPETVGTLLWVGLFALGGGAFLLGFLTLSDSWWMAIPGCTLLGLAGTIFVEEYLTGFGFGGSLFLLGIGAGFWLVYTVQREFWWALIPAGVLTTLAIVAGVDAVGAFDSGAIFFLGLGLTFVLVALVPTPEGRMTWAWIPAAVLLGLSLIIASSFEALIGLLWPLFLIGLGLLILYRTVLRRSG